MKRISLVYLVLSVGLLLLGPLSGSTGNEQASGPAAAKISRSEDTRNAAPLLERTAGGHVIGFGPREVMIGNGGYALRLDFIGSPGVSPVSLESRPSAGLKAPALGTVVYRNLWPGVTLTYRGEKSDVAKSVWTVAPGAAVESIRLRANVPVRTGRLGNLVYAFPKGTMLESKPVAWQEVGGKRVPVDVTYRLVGDREFGFTASARDARYPLVIDPILSWNTFLGGTGNDDSCNSLTLDSSGNIYIVGYSNATWGSPIRAYSGNYDTFVAKLSANGNLLWNTFLGGQMSDYGYAIGLDAYGNIYASGQSNMTWGSPIRAFTSAPDEFVAKLDPSGTLVWNTFLGGTGYDYNNGMAVDQGGNCYVVAASDASWGSPVHPFNAIPAGYKDWSIAKVDNNGYLQWSTFLGGTGNDTAFGVALDASAGVYVSGHSRSSWGTPINPYSGAKDITIAKLNALDGVLQWNTFFGQAGNDDAYGITVGTGGLIYVAGMSDATWGSPLNPFGGGATDGFVLALEADGNYLGHTFIGGTGDDGCTSVAVARSETIYVCGYSTAAWGSPDKPFGGSTDGFVVRLGATGGFQALTFVGGAGDDYCNAVALDKNRNFCVAGASAASFGSPIRAFGAANDGFVAKLTFMPDALNRHAVGDFDGDGADEAAVDFGPLGIWEYNAGAWSQINTADPEGLVVADVDGNNVDEIVGDFGENGLWLWKSGSWTEISAVDVEGLAVGDVDADGSDEVVGDFGPLGLWLYNGGAWTQLSGVDASYIGIADLDGVSGLEIVGDFGAVGLWVWHAGTWFQLSGVNPDFFVMGNTDGLGGQEIVGDFGTTGLWLCNSGSWTQLSGVDANYEITADTDADGAAEIVGDFGPVGLWIYNAGAWTVLSSQREEYMIAADVDGDLAKEVFVDFGPVGLWEYDGGAWVQLSGVNPDFMMAGDFDGDGQAELMVDFGTLGVWVNNGGSWTQVSNVNPD